MSDSNDQAPIFLTSREAKQKCNQAHGVAKLPKSDSKPTDKYPGDDVKQDTTIRNNSISSQTVLNNAVASFGPSTSNTLHELPTLAFPVTINIEARSTQHGCSILGSENYDTWPSSNDSISRNNNSPSVRVKRSSTSKLTMEEEERVAEILRQEDDVMENYILPSEEETTRDTELDDLLAGLGYQFSLDEGESSTDINTRGDPVLRELAVKRSQEEKAKAIDQALRALLREPLPRVIKYLQDNVTDDGISLLSSIGDSTITSPVNEDVIQQLVQEIKLSLERDNMDLADGDSVRLLATSILNNEAAKISIWSASGETTKTHASQQH